MTPAMKVFADEWLSGAATGKKFNGRAAYEFAGYTTNDANPYSGPSKLLRHPEVQEYIQSQLDEHAMSATEVLLRFTNIARAEIGEVVTADAHGNLQIDTQAVLNNKEFIKNFGFDSNGNPKIDFHDTMQALRDIAKVRGMLKDSVEVSGPGGGAIPVAMTVQFVAPPGVDVGDLNSASQPDVAPEDFSEFDEE